MNPGSRRRRGVALAIAGLVAVLAGCGKADCAPASQAAPAVVVSTASPSDPASKAEVAAHAVKPDNLMAQGWHFDHLIHPGQAVSLAPFMKTDEARFAQLNFALTNHFVNEWLPQTGGTTVVAYTLVPEGGVVNQAGLDLYVVLVRVSVPNGYVFIDARQLKIDTLAQPAQFFQDIQDAVVGLYPGDAQKVTLANYGTFSVMMTDEQRGYDSNAAPSTSSTPEPPAQSHSDTPPVQVNNTNDKQSPVKKPAKAKSVHAPAPTNEEIIARYTDSVADADLYPEADRTDKLDRLGDAVTQLTGHNWLQVRANFQGSGSNLVLSNVRTLAGDAIESWVFSSNGRYRVRVELLDGVGPVLTFTRA